jgi:Protein of unknown function (DUF3891)
MVLYPLLGPPSARNEAHSISAWQAVENRQRAPAHLWWLVAQIDHAVLAGELAARLDFPAIPTLPEEAIRAIAVHDAGWAEFDVAEDARTDSRAKMAPPRSFLEIRPAEFLVAWTRSIDRAERVGALGAMIVSEHFCRLGRVRLNTRRDDVQDARRLEAFLVEEAGRQGRLGRQVTSVASEIGALTDILQFCDLVSLYLCCGAGEPAEFPQRFGETTVHVRSEGDAFLFTPAVFGRGAALGVSARGYPEKNRTVSLPFLLA